MAFIRSLVFFLLFSTVFPAISAAKLKDFRGLNQTFSPEEESEKMSLIREHLKKINKPYVKSIHSPDGDIVDCVLIHQQPAFDHPLLKGTKPLDPPKRPNGSSRNNSGINLKNLQLWSSSGESCPNGTIPIRRTTEQDILHAGSIETFGKKNIESYADQYPPHEYGIGSVSGGQYLGAKARFNVWNPYVAEPLGMSLSQFWLVAGDSSDLNSIEAGWTVNPSVYRDYKTRFFIYWTSDGYSNGCYDLKCPGFVQTNPAWMMGSAVNPLSVYGGQQTDVEFLIWRDPQSGNWWLEIEGTMVGYYPYSMYTHLQGPADQVNFGGEIVNFITNGYHTKTVMGSGHFAEEGYEKAAYIRNIQVMDLNYVYNSSPIVEIVVPTPQCYNALSGSGNEWGTYIYFGGPGSSPECYLN